MKKLFILAALLALAGCASPPAQPATITDWYLGYAVWGPNDPSDRPRDSSTADNKLSFTQCQDAALSLVYTLRESGFRLEFMSTKPHYKGWLLENAGGTTVILSCIGV